VLLKLLISVCSDQSQMARQPRLLFCDEDRFEKEYESVKNTFDYII